MGDDRFADEQARAARRADEGWSFVGPSSTLSMRTWREPSTLSTHSSVSSLSRHPEPVATARPTGPSQAVAEVLDHLSDEDEHPQDPVLPVERVAAPTGLLAPPPLVTQPLVPHEPVAGQVLGLQQHPGSLPQPPSAPGWRPPQLPGRQPVRRTPTRPGAARTAKGQFVATLVTGLVFAGPALFSLGRDLFQDEVPPSGAQQAQPVQQAEDGSLEVSRDFGTFTVPAGWSEQYTDDMQQATLLREEDPSAAVVVTHVARVDTSIGQACQEILGTDQEVRKLADVPVIGGVAGVAYRMQDGNGYTATAHCAAKDDGMIAITGSTVDTPQKTIDAAMRRIASSLH